MLIGPKLSGKEEYKKNLLSKFKNFDVVEKTSSKTFDIVASMLEDGSDVIIDVDELTEKKYRLSLMKEVRRRLSRGEVEIMFVVFDVKRRKYWKKAKGDELLLLDISNCLKRQDEIDSDDAVYFDEVIYVFG